MAKAKKAETAAATEPAAAAAAEGMIYSLIFSINIIQNNYIIVVLNYSFTRWHDVIGTCNH